MRNAGNQGLRELAHDYYKGKLSYESYRRERTQLLDRLTEVTGDKGCAGPTTRQSNTARVTGRSLDTKPERSWYLRGPVWMVIMTLISIILVVLAIKSGLVRLPLSQLGLVDTVVSEANLEMVGVNSGKERMPVHG